MITGPHTNFVEADDYHEFVSIQNTVNTFLGLSGENAYKFHELGLIRGKYTALFYDRTAKNSVGMLLGFLTQVMQHHEAVAVIKQIQGQ